MTDSQEKYSLLDRLGLCHKCEKARPAPGKKYCYDCLDKIRAENAERYDSEKAKEYNPRRRQLYQEKKKSGICVRCSKKATHGVYCYECSIKQKKHNEQTAKRRKWERREKGLIPDSRKENQLCVRCGESSKAYYCENCMRKIEADLDRVRVKRHFVFGNGS